MMRHLLSELRVSVVLYSSHQVEPPSAFPRTRCNSRGAEIIIYIKKVVPVLMSRMREWVHIYNHVFLTSALVGNGQLHALTALSQGRESRVPTR
jgi:hypothetical protein